MDTIQAMQLGVFTAMKPIFLNRGFLPEQDPLQRFPCGSPFSVLDDIGRDLPSLLHDPEFRAYARRLEIPPWPEERVVESTLPQLRLYYVRLGFLASGYVNQVGQPSEKVLPRNIAAALCRVCRLLGRPPILSYDGYALYNWKRFDPSLSHLRRDGSPYSPPLRQPNRGQDREYDQGVSEAHAECPKLGSRVGKAEVAVLDAKRVPKPPPLRKDAFSGRLGRA
jgi:hypothetical protein